MANFNEDQKLEELRIARENDDISKQIGLLSDIGDCYRKNGKYSSALEIYSELAGIGDVTGDLGLETRSYLKQAICHMDMSNPSQAEDLFNVSYSLATKTYDFRLMIDVLIEYIEFLKNQNDIERVNDLREEAEAFSTKQAGNYRLQEIRTEKMQYDSEKVTSEPGAQEIKPTPLPELIEKLHEEAVIYENSNEYEQSLLIREKLLEIINEQLDLEAQSTTKKDLVAKKVGCLIRMGEIYEKIRMPMPAYDHYERALEIGTNILRNNPSRLVLLQKLVRLSEKLGYYDATEAYQREIEKKNES